MTQKFLVTLTGRRHEESVPTLRSRWTERISAREAGIRSDIMEASGVNEMYTWVSSA